VLAEHPDKEGVAYLGVVFDTPRFSGPLWRRAWPHAEEIIPDLDLPGLPELPNLDELAVDAGVVVTLLQGDSPARDAGIKSGDIIHSIDGEPVSAPEELTDAIRAHEPGDQVELGVSSPPYDELREVNVALGEHPDKDGVAYLGVRIAAGFQFEQGQGLPKRFRFHLNPRGVLPEWFPWGLGDEPIRKWIEPFLGRDA
jgi:hypothetical protein